MPLLGLLTASFYMLFTLLPDSHSLMVSWPWVLIWQIGLCCAILWGVREGWAQPTASGPEVEELDGAKVSGLVRLGFGLDECVALAAIGLLGTIGFAPFRPQAIWQGWPLVCHGAALYALVAALRKPKVRQQVLLGQASLMMGFIGVSLVLWCSQTVWPELALLQQLHAWGIPWNYDLNRLELRNWAPFGHQNYVAGYLLLNLPLLAVLASRPSRQRWLWLAGLLLGAVALYSTNSRGASLALVIMSGVSLMLGLLLWLRSHKAGQGQQRLILGIAAIAVLGLGLASPRLRAMVASLGSGQGNSELGYRLINAIAGWRIGLDHWLFGAGPGSTPLLYQRYRPAWAGREAELVYQLHSTPVQIWAEWGLWGWGVGLGTIAILLYQTHRWWQVLPPESCDRPLMLGLLFGLGSYGLLSLTDYQLDNWGISGSLVVLLALQISLLQSTVPPPPIAGFMQKRIALGGLGMLLAIAFWSFPVHRAWYEAKIGFLALEQKNVPQFMEHLQRATQLARWQPYYWFQLGWNLGNLSLQVADPATRQSLQQSSLAAFTQATQISPHWEFGYTHLGWLLLGRSPVDAAAAFQQAARLVPGKRAMFYGLGMALLAQGKTDGAIAALVIECLNDPLLITSPIWQSPPFSELYLPVLTGLETAYTELLTQLKDRPAIVGYLHRVRGGLRWWQGQWTAAHADWDEFGDDLSRQILQLSQTPGSSASTPLKPLSWAIAAWVDPAQRTPNLQKAWVAANRRLPSEDMLIALRSSMEQANSFHDWVRHQAPSRPFRRERQGFGVLSRYIDGPLPSDLMVGLENVAIATFFPQVLPAWVYQPPLDLALQSRREALLR